MSAYESSRNNDVSLERYVSDYLDAYFYSRLTASGTPCVRRTDSKSQFAGIDITMGRLNVDEKVKVKGGYVSRILDYPSFEISFRSQYDGLITDGWFVRKGMLTDYYAFISVFANTDDWRMITTDSITSAVVLFVAKDDVIKYVGGIESVRRDAEVLRSLNWLGEDTKRYDHRKFHLKLSMSYPEQPVNLVIRRERLLKLPHTREIHVDESGWRKINPCISP